MDRVQSVAEEYKPWKKGISWSIVAVQGICAALIGLYFLLAPDSANSTIRFLLAAILIVSSIIDIRNGFAGFNTFPAEPNSMAPYLLLRAGAGIAFGVWYFVASRADYMTEENARFLLGFGMVAYGIIGMVGAVLALFDGQLKWAAIISNVLFLAVGAVLIWSKDDSADSSDIVRYLGIASLIGGAALLVYAWFLKEDQEAAAATAAAAAATPSAPLGSADSGLGVQVPSSGLGAPESAEAAMASAAAGIEASEAAVPPTLESILPTTSPPA